MSNASKIRGLTAVAALTLSSASAFAAVKPFTAEYTANYMSMQGSAHMTVAAADGGRWRYSLDIVSPLAELKQSTVFDEKDNQLRPLSGVDTAKVLTRKVNKNATYDWSRGEATWTGDVKADRAGPIKLQAGDLDALLVNLAIVRDAKAGKTMNYRMVEDGRVKQLTYTVAGKEQISVNGAQKQATKVTSTDGEKQTIVWVVDGLPVPARILQRDKGQDAIDLHVSSVK